MRNINIVSKASAMNIKSQYPDCRTMKYCSGKYEWYGSAKHYIGRELGGHDNVLAVWVERRQDSHGAYASMMCIVK